MMPNPEECSDTASEQENLGGAAGRLWVEPVANTAIAYLARLAFGEANHRVFYNDIAGAVLWLSEGVAGANAR